jgi:hypothetical protein
VAQQHTFYPPGDVDRVTFVAKSNHRYRIYTAPVGGSPPPVPVDTVLRVTMGSTTKTNDDRVPGELYSYVELQNDTPNDQQVRVTITNNGLYTPEASYVVQVDDLTIINGDEFEPDLDVKQYISVGEMQRHTFYPHSDIDRVALQVETGRDYVVQTCGVGGLSPCQPLVPGVDTLVVVQGPVTNCNPANCQSDDANPGTGHLGSRVEFTAIADGEVSITIYNKGLFGPEMEYMLAVSEAGAPAPTPPPSTATPFFSPTPTLTHTPVPPFTATPGTSSGGYPPSVLAARSAASKKTPQPRPRVSPRPTAVPDTTTASRGWGLAALLKPLERGGATLDQQAQGPQAVRFTLLLRLASPTPTPTAGEETS